MQVAGPFRQHVPRPEGGRPGAAPPWDGAFAAPASVPLGLVRSALAPGGFPSAASPAPGSARWRGEARPGTPGTQGTQGTRTGARGRTGRRAAVLVACFAAPPAGEASVVLIRRAAGLERDPGHVALPGGIVEPGEEPVEAALREAEEEVGLDPGAVEVVGSLDPVERPADKGLVLPFVGLLAAPPVLEASPGEVEAVLEVPLAELVADGVAWEERWPVVPGGGPAVATRRVRFFASEVLGDDLVWGVTARILWDLLSRVVATAGGGPGAGGRPGPIAPDGAGLG